MSNKNFNQQTTPEHTPKNSDRKHGKSPSNDRPKFQGTKGSCISNPLTNAKGFKSNSEMNELA